MLQTAVTVEESGALDCYAGELLDLPEHPTPQLRACASFVAPMNLPTLDMVEMIRSRWIH